MKHFQIKLSTRKSSLLPDGLDLYLPRCNFLRPLFHPLVSFTAEIVQRIFVYLPRVPIKRIKQKAELKKTFEEPKQNKDNQPNGFVIDETFTLRRLRFL